VKVTCAQRETLRIAGFALKHNNFDGIYLGRLKGKNLTEADIMGRPENRRHRRSTVRCEPQFLLLDELISARQELDCKVGISARAAPLSP
jgi:hypothetical protein